jgi:hypothetical protein
MKRDITLDDPAIIEREIADTRASLHRKVEELQHRLNPRERAREAGERVGERVREAGERVREAGQRVRSAVEGVDARAYANEYAGAAALAAVGVGAALAVKGLRRRSPSVEEECIAPSDIDLMGE